MGALDISLEASNDVVSIEENFTLTWDLSQSGPKIVPKENEEGGLEIKKDIPVNEDQLNALNKALDQKLSEIVELNESVNEELLDELIAAINSKSIDDQIEIIEEISE
jgi:hypothetical protein